MNTIEVVAEVHGKENQSAPEIKQVRKNKEVIEDKQENVSREGNMKEQKNNVERVCSFWVRGRCKFGVSCNYAHPVLCTIILENGTCQKRDCEWFHPKMCSVMKQTGQCHRGQKCYFTHFRQTHNSSMTKSSRNPCQKDVGQPMTKNRKEPYKILYQNIRRLITENSKKKIEYFKDYVLENKILAMNFTETWLDNLITNDINIKGYQVFRGDRKGRRGGGTAIYLNEDFEANILLEASVEKCEMIAIFIEKLNTINIVIYRPPDTKLSIFTSIVDKMNNLLSNMNAPEPTVILTGDFNFPFVKWTKGTHNGCRWEITSSSTTLDEKAQFLKLTEVVDKYNLVQAIEEPTRERNTLDLVFTNDISIFTHIEVLKSSLSDHHQIEVTTNFKTNNRDINNETPNYGGETDFWQLNFHNDNVSWSTINKEINDIPWHILFNEKNTETCTNILLSCLLMLCIKLIPRKKTKK
ncbi:unnamed protein product [Meganyctiphanes norvegica]|uniref:C3H1-type domain-containing protein n=1 Tax=Meganyctiphanes norvegica TaxID=48144 RepID=A0AAV2S6U9_MEGNR